jgi:PAS domain S-box-containing protein
MAVCPTPHRDLQILELRSGRVGTFTYVYTGCNDPCVPNLLRKLGENGTNCTWRKPITMASFLSSNSAKILDALDLSFAVIEFDVDGKILKANKNFCDLMGYSQAELLGKHHRMFLDADYAGSSDYASFWNKLRGGEFICSEFTRLAKSGKEIFIRGNYNPIKSSSGKVLKIVKFANDITQTKM